MSRTPASSLALGVAAMALGLVLREDHIGRYALLFLGPLLILGALIRSVASSEPTAPEPSRWIDVPFSGNTGRFEVRSRGDGRRVEVVQPGDTVVAELIARDEGDELVVDFGLADGPDVEAFGAAIGLAIEMVAAADEDTFGGARNSVGLGVADPPPILEGSLAPRVRASDDQPA